MRRHPFTSQRSLDAFYSQALTGRIVVLLALTAIFTSAFTPPRLCRRRAVALRAGRTQTIVYSPNFHRHVVCEGAGNETKVLESFLWFDEAKFRYPSAAVAPFVPNDPTWKSAISGGGLDEYSAYDTAPGDMNCTIAAPTNRTIEAYMTVISRLRSPLGTSLLQHFPESDQHWVKERLLFLLSPCPENISDLDWPRMLNQGYGAGLTESQLTTAIIEIQHLLFVHPTESRARKMPLVFYYAQLRVPMDLISEARAELDGWLRGASPADAATFAFLHSTGVSWDQCRIMLEAFSSSLISCDLDPSWELYGSGPVRKSFSDESLHYLRMRLQITPSEVFAMIKSHSRLSTYTADNLKSHLDELQSILKLSSGDVQRLVFRNPSVLGVSAQKLQSRVAFLADEVRLTRSQIRESVLKLPSLLQYSIDGNLRPKVKYLTDEIGISESDLTSMVLKNPAMLGVSFQQRIVAVTTGLHSVCGMSKKDICSVLVRVPQLLSLNWETNVKMKIDFLVDRLNLTQPDLQSLVLSAPRVLMHSVDSSLLPKIETLERAAASSDVALRVVRDNPSLLLSTSSVLEGRVSSYIASNNTFEDFFTSKRTYKRKVANARSYKKRGVTEMSDGLVVRSFSDVGAAAESIGTSRVNMYSIIKTGRFFKGKTYVYACKNDGAKEAPNVPPVQSIEAALPINERLKQKMKTTVVPRRTTAAPPSNERFQQDLNRAVVPGKTRAAPLSNKRFPQDSKRTCVPGKTRATPPSNERLQQDLKRTFAPCTTRARLVDALRRSQPIRKEGVTKHEKNRLYLQAFVSGRAYPPERAREVRGKRKAGGLAMHFPQLHGCDIGVNLLRAAATECFESQIMSAPDSGTRFCDGLIVLGYAYLNPTRNRCSLYVCREVLRVVMQLLRLEGSCPELRDSCIDIDIFTDSNYAWTLLNNSTSVLRWGSHARKEDFVYDGTMQKWRANTDILYPLSRTFFRVVNQELVPLEGKPASVVKDLRVNFSFCRQHRIEPSDPSSVERPLDEYAQKAAAWQYERAQKFMM